MDADNIGKGRAGLLAVTIRWEFNVVPKYATRRFVCMSDLNEFRELDQDTVATSAWYFKPKGGLEASDPAAFELVEFTVDGEPRKIRRSVKAGSQTYTVAVGKEEVDAGQPVNVAYTYRTVTSINGHLLRVRVDQPTRGISIEIDYTATTIKDIAIVDYVASSANVRVSSSPTTVPVRSVGFELDGWLLPHSGVAFVWSGTEAHDGNL